MKLLCMYAFESLMHTGTGTFSSTHENLAGTKTDKLQVKCIRPVGLVNT